MNGRWMADGWQMDGRWIADRWQMNARWMAEERACSDKSLHIYLYTNKARCVAGRLSASANRQRLDGRGRDGDGQMHSAVLAASERVQV